MMKKQVAIPIKQEEDGINWVEAVQNVYSPFMRGVMEFDDYNYKMHNQYILRLNPKEVAPDG